MSDLIQIMIGVGIIVCVLLIIVWYFRAPKGIGKGDFNKLEDKSRTNSTTSINPKDM